MKDKIEAILFAAGRYIEVEYIAKLLQADLRSVKKALAELREDYEKREGCAIHVATENNMWKLQVKDAYLEYASKIVSDTEITKTMLETLAVVAWKNPISQAELIKIRGPAAYEHIGELVDRGFLTKVPEGRSFKLTLQQKFFDYFDVEGREDMKKLFAPIEADVASAQAEIDAKQAAYDERTRAAQEALQKGTPMPPEPTASSEHSAQNKTEGSADLIAEAAKAAENIGQKIAPAQPTPEFKAVEEAVKEFGQELGELKAEIAAAKHEHHEHKKTKKQGVVSEVVPQTEHTDSPK